MISETSTWLGRTKDSDPYYRYGVNDTKDMTPPTIIIENILSFCAMISDSISGTRKKHSEIMAVQIVSQFFYSPYFSL